MPLAALRTATSTPLRECGLDATLRREQTLPSASSRVAWKTAKREEPGKHLYRLFLRTLHVPANLLWPEAQLGLSDLLGKKVGNERKSGVEPEKTQEAAQVP